MVRCSALSALAHCAPARHEQPHHEHNRRVGARPRRAANQRRTRQDLTGRDRDRRRHRSRVGVLRLLRLRHRLGAGVPVGVLPVREGVGGDLALVRRVLICVHRAADRHGAVDEVPEALRPRSQADGGAVATRRVDRRHRLPARLRDARVRRHRAAVDPARRPGHCARRLLGRVALAAGTECAGKPAWFLRGAWPARCPDRLHAGRRAFRVPVRKPRARRFLRLGLALHLLCRVRDQRGGTLRATAVGRDNRIRRTPRHHGAHSVAGA